MTTAQVIRVVGVHRTTLFRWTQLGLFPPKHLLGGWLRSDIEEWLTQRAPMPHSATRSVAARRKREGLYDL